MQRDSETLRPRSRPRGPGGARVAQQAWLKRTMAQSSASPVSISSIMTPLRIGARFDNLRQEVSELRSLLREQAEIINKLEQAEQSRASGDDGGDEDVNVFEPPHSLSCYCIESAMSSLRPSFQGVLTMFQLVVVTSFQYILAHGFFDSVWLIDTLATVPGFKSNIRPAEFYYIQPLPGVGVPGGLDRTFRFSCDGEDGLASDSCEWLPRFNVLASIAAICLLAAGPILGDDQQTLLGMQPVDHLLFDERLGNYARSQPYQRTLLLILWRLGVALVLQVCWGARVLLLPAFALFGTAISLADADSTFDIVLNSIAIGFVFEIDDMLYEAIIPFRKRSRYEAGKTQKVVCAAFSAPGSVKVRWKYVWVLLLVSLILAVDAYFMQITSLNQGAYGHYVYYRVALMVVLRAAVLGAATLHTHMRAHSAYVASFRAKVNAVIIIQRLVRGWLSRHRAKQCECAGSAQGNGGGRNVENREKPATRAAPGALSRTHWPPGRKLLVARLVLSVGTTLGTGFFMYMVVYDTADALLGYAYAPSLVTPGSTWDLCALQNGNATQRAAACQGISADGLSYFPSNFDLEQFTVLGRSVWDLKNVFSEWWQLTYAAYYL